MESFNVSSSLNSVVNSKFGFKGVDYKSFDVLPIEGQKQFLNESYNYLSPLLKEWLESSNGHLIGLAKLAERWNVKASPKAQFKLLESEMKTLNILREKMRKANQPYDYYDARLETLKAQHTSLRAKYPDLV